jgi:hypothetical protein
MTWPPRWTEPHFKHPVSTKVERFVRRTKRDNEEDAEKRKVRNRDKYCRFPMCGCGKMKLRTEVSHAQHKGMGGNPARDRSKAELMVLVCGARHKDNVTSIDRGNIRWRPLTALGSNGPIAWDVRSVSGDWFELARETAPHVYQPFSSKQQATLLKLSEMLT